MGKKMEEPSGSSIHWHEACLQAQSAKVAQTHGSPVGRKASGAALLDLVDEVGETCSQAKLRLLRNEKVVKASRDLGRCANCVLLTVGAGKLGSNPVSFREGSAGGLEMGPRDTLDIEGQGWIHNVPSGITGRGEQGGAASHVPLRCTA